MKVFVYLFTYYVFLVYALPAAAKCPDGLPPRIEVLQQFLKELGSLPRWNEFNIQSVPSLFVDQSVSKSCGYLFWNGAVIEKVTLVPAWNSTSVGYDYLPNTNKYKNLPFSKSKGGILKGGLIPCCRASFSYKNLLAQIMDKYGFSGMYIQWMSPLNTPFNESKEGLGFVLSLKYHEIFHFFYQNRFFTNYSWPHHKLIPPVHSREIVNHCYKKNKIVQEGLKSEVMALQRSLASVHKKGKLKRELRNFIRLRRERSQLVGQKNGYSCLELEPYLEYLEGLPQFLGDLARVKVGSVKWGEYVLWVSRQAMSSLKGHNLYYWVGAMQLMILLELYGEKEFSELTKLWSSSKRYLSFVELIDEAILK